MTDSINNYIAGIPVRLNLSVPKNEIWLMGVPPREQIICGELPNGQTVEEWIATHTVKLVRIEGICD